MWFVVIEFNMCIVVCVDSDRLFLIYSDPPSCCCHCWVDTSSLPVCGWLTSGRAGWCTSSVGCRRNSYHTICTWSTRPHHQDTMVARCLAILSPFLHLPVCSQFSPSTAILHVCSIGALQCVYLWYALIRQFPPLCLWADNWITGCCRWRRNIHWFTFLRDKEGFVLYIWFFSKRLQRILYKHILVHKCKYTWCTYVSEYQLV